MATLKRFAFAQLTVTDSQLAQVPAGKSWTVKNIHVCNPGGSAVPLSLNLVASAGTSAANNALLDGIEVDPHGVLSLDTFVVLAAGEQLRGLGDGLVVAISGVEQ